MDLKNLAWLLILPGILTFQQNDFKIVFERAEVVKFDSSYLRFAKTHNFKFNRTNAVTVLMADMKLDLGNEVKVEIQAHRKASNEYREFPIRFMFDLCQYEARNEFGLREVYACGNSTGCPFKKGIYTSCPWAPNANKFPPNIPAGSYMIEITFIFRSVNYLFVQGYGTVKYPECKSCLF